MLGPLRILLAEDEVVSQKVAHLMLSQLGHSVDAVSNGLEAVDAVRLGRYDVVLMDVQMPELDGLAATRRIRAEIPTGRQPTIVAVTASGLVEHQTACITAGMDAYLAKPLRQHALRALLASVRGGAEFEPGDSPTPDGSAAASALAADWPSDRREAAVRARLAELAGPDGDDDELLAALLRSFVNRTPQLLDQLDAAVAECTPEQVERVAHALSGAAENIGGAALARALRHVEAQARTGALPAEEALHQLRHEHNMLRPILTGIAGQMESVLSGPAHAAGF